MDLHGINQYMNFVATYQYDFNMLGGNEKKKWSWPPIKRLKVILLRNVAELLESSSIRLKCIKSSNLSTSYFGKVVSSGWVKKKWWFN